MRFINILLLILSLFTLQASAQQKDIAESLQKIVVLKRKLSLVKELSL